MPLADADIPSSKVSAAATDAMGCSADERAPQIFDLISDGLSKVRARRGGADIVELITHEAARR